MREILFRGKNFKGEWVYGDLVHFLDGSVNIFPLEHLDEETDYEVYPDTVGQFTGLLDKSKNRIFENDIVLTDEAGWIANVSYGTDGFMCTDDHGGFSGYCNWGEFEVIGNIHDGVKK